MPDSLPPEYEASEATQPIEPSLNGRYRRCEICGQAYDHVDAMLAAYHSIETHGPTPD